MIRLFTALLGLAVLLAAHPHAQSAPPKIDPATGKPIVMINLNTAKQGELEVLPGIGPKTAARIIEYREKKGPFKKIEELMNVQGIGEKSFLKLRPQLTVAAKSDVAGQQ